MGLVLAPFLTLLDLGEIVNSMKANLFDFSPVFIFKCFLKLSAVEDAKGKEG